MFAELLTWSNFSFLRGASHPEELVSRAHELGLLALGICEREGIYGSVRAWVRAREIGQKLLIGAELSLELAETPSQGKAAHASGRLPSLVLYPEHLDGYRDLCRAITLAHAEHEKGRAGYRLYRDGLPSQGLIIIVPADTLLSLNDDPNAELVSGHNSSRGFRGSTHQDRVLDYLANVAHGQTYLATFRHLDGFDEARQAAVLRAHNAYGFPIIATARSRFHHASKRRLSDVVDCIRRGCRIDNAGTKLHSNVEATLYSEVEMQQRFADHLEWVERTQEIVERCHFDLGQISYHFPCSLLPDETADAKLERLVWQGATRRYPHGLTPQVKAQLVHELDIIRQMGMASYFLSTWEVVEMARARRILCQGRGSAANSAICFVLGITAVDPSRSSMLFERFMSPERHEPPDIDIDFEHERREEIITEIYDTYGRDRAAMVSEVICYRARSALREVAKVFGLSAEQIDRLTGAVSGWGEVSQAVARLKEVGLDAEDERIQQILELAKDLQGFPRHLSIHVGGFVLSAESLERVAPIEPARMPGRTVIPFDKDDIDALGFFKVDVLGLGMLTAIRKALEYLHHDNSTDNASQPFDPLEALARIPAEDPAVYRSICRADTVGVFQIESRAQMAMLPRLRPQRFYDLVIEVAIVRPGPIHGGMVHPYLRRRNGEESIAYAHPSLANILERTLGVPLFQEQVMQIAIAGAGYSGGEADQLRRDMAAWRKNGRLLRHRERLLDGFSKNGISSAFGEALFEQIKGFGEYGFPESHAASFALLVYASAWQKTHYPAHFAVALLNAQPMGFYSPHSIIRDAQAHGVAVRDVDVSYSHWDHTLEGPNSKRVIRLGFRIVKQVSQHMVERLVSERARRGFSELEDFRLRVTPAKNELEALAEAGALDSLQPGRRNALWAARRPDAGQLFASIASKRNPNVRLPEVSRGAMLRFDYDTKGLCLNDHPLLHLRRWLTARRVVTANQLPQYRRGERLAVAGLVLCRQQPMTASGILFVTLEDETGVINLIVREQVQARYGLMLRQASLLYARGRLERTDVDTTPGAVPVIHLLAEEFERLDRGGRALSNFSRDFH
ncbi:MAG TPA: error-prone DNA polymerase [Polyangiaceae bacterium]